MPTVFQVHHQVRGDILRSAMDGLNVRRVRAGQRVKLPDALPGFRLRRLYRAGSFVGKRPRKLPDKPQPAAKIDAVRFHIRDDANIRRLRTALLGIQVIGRNIVPGQRIRLVKSKRLDEQRGVLRRHGDFLGN